MLRQSTPSRYLNLLTDYGFKTVFGRESNKDLLIDFINAVLEGEQKIVDLQYRNSERLGIAEQERKVVFDLLCENDRGETILVELQQAREEYFKDRLLYYASGLIQEQGIRGNWDYRLRATYVIAVLNFHLTPGEPKRLRRVCLADTVTKIPWGNSLQMVFLEVPEAPNSIDKGSLQFDRWLYLFAHMHRLSEIPGDLGQEVFLRLFEACEIGRFAEAERVRYLESLSETERMEEALKYASKSAAIEARRQGAEEGREQGLTEGREKGLTEGRAERSYEIARSLKLAGVQMEIIVSTTGLSQLEIESL